MEFRACLDYIHSFFDRVTYKQEKDSGDLIGLPNPFVAPNDQIFSKQQFYWDSYFTIRGLLLDGRIDLARGMVDNLVYLLERFSHIPATNKVSALGISQPPFLTSMALEVYSREKDREWLGRVAEAAEREVRDYWRNKKHLVLGFSRYYGHGTHLSAEMESAWDFTSRFNQAGLNYIPVDLNSLLFKYDLDLARIWKELHEPSRARFHKKRAERTRERIIKFMFDQDLGFFFDYNFITGKRRKFYSVAGFYPLWVGLVNKSMARKVKESGLETLEERGGIANTQSTSLSRTRPCQHDWPNGWPHQQLIVVEGLENYGFREDAERIARKWLETNLLVFERTGKLWEKYDVVNLDVGKPGLYPTQPGFGWTSAVFLVLYDRYLS